MPMPLTRLRLEQGALALHEACSHEGAAPKYISPVPFLMSVWTKQDQGILEGIDGVMSAVNRVQ